MNILVPSDFSESSQRALHIAVQGGQLVATKLHLLHAIEEDVDRKLHRAGLTGEQVQTQHEQIRQEAERKLHEQLVQTDYRTLSGGVRVHVVEGPADLMILKAIEEHGIDHLLMSVGMHHDIASMLLGDTAERLLPHVPCSLVAIKPEGFQSPVSLA
jgi:universal stress protein E